MKKSRELSRVVQATPSPEKAAPATTNHDEPEPPSRVRRCTLVAVGAVLIVMGIILTFWWVISDPGHARFLGAGDCWSFYGPALHFLDHRIHHGELPLWNPLYLCGQPHAANPQGWVFYPPNLIRSLLTFDPTPMKTHVGIAFMIFFHLVLCGVSTLLLARRHKLSFGASLVAAFAFTFSAALTTRSVGHWVFLNTVAWLPLFLLMVNRAMSAARVRKKICFALAGGLVWGMCILGGTPNLMVIVGLTAAAYAVMLRALYPRAGMEPAHSAAQMREEGTPREKKKRGTRNRQSAPTKPRRRGWLKGVVHPLMRDLMVLGLLLAAGTLVATPLLFPAAQFSGYTDRGAKDDTTQEELVHVSGFWNLIKILAIYQGHGHYEGPRAAGAIVFWLGLAALVCRPRRDAVLFMVLFLILLDCSVSRPLVFGRLVTWLTPFTLSNPGRNMIVACLPLGLLAGVGADAVVAPVASLRWRVARSGAVLLLGVGTTLIVALAARPEPVLPVGKVVVVLPVVACVIGLLAGWIPGRTMWGIALAVLVFGETLVWNRQLVPSIVPEVQQYKGSFDAMRESKTFWADNRRGTYIEPNVPMYDLEPAMNGYDPLQIRDVRDVLCVTKKMKVFRRMVFSVEVAKENMRGNLFLKRQFWLARQYVNGPLPDRNTPFPAATTVFLENPGDLPLPQVDAASLPRTGVSKEFSPLWIKPQGSPPQVLRSEDFTETSNACALPAITLPALHSSLFIRLSSTCKMEVIPLFQDIKTKREEFGKGMNLKAGDGTPESFEVPLPDFQEIKISFVPDFRKQTGQFSVLDLLIESDLNDEDKLISVASRTANTVAVDLRDLPGDRMLVCVDAFYPGWHAYVDGRPAYIYKADGAFKGVMVPRGSHRVTFVFKPFVVFAGMFVSVSTLAGITAALVLLLRKPRGVGPAAPTVSANAH
jgi:hypothetical protein